MINKQVYQIHVLARSLFEMLYCLMNRKTLKLDVAMKMLDDLKMIVDETKPNEA